MSEGYIGPPDNTYISEEWLSEEASTFSFLNKLRFFKKKKCWERSKSLRTTERKRHALFCSSYTKIGTTRERRAWPRASTAHTFVKRFIVFASTSVFVWIYKLAVSFEWRKGKSHLCVVELDSKKGWVNRLFLPSPPPLQGRSSLRVDYYPLFTVEWSLNSTDHLKAWLELPRAPGCQIESTK